MKHVNLWSWSDARYMATRRADYYSYLATLLAACDGRRSLRDFFFDDMTRFGAGSPRGRLSAIWHKRFELSGGNLAQTWSGVFPAGDLALIAVAQAEGTRALPAALADLARTTRLLQRVRQTLWMTCAGAMVACVVVLCMLAAIPMMTVPRLQRTFDSVPEAFWGPATRSLFATADLLQIAAPVLAVVLVAGIAIAAWSLPRWIGPSRTRLDSLPMMRLYRDFQAIRFLCALTLVIGEQKHTDLRLRDGLAAVSLGAQPWMNRHLSDMAARMEQGAVQCEIFDTGLFDQDTFWFMSDVIAAQGLGPGLAQARERIELTVAQAIALHSGVLRWTMLLGAVGCGLGIAFWHFAALDELRRAMTLSYSMR